VLILNCTEQWKWTSSGKLGVVDDDDYITHLTVIFHGDTGLHFPLYLLYFPFMSSYISEVNMVANAFHLLCQRWLWCVVAGSDRQICVTVWVTSEWVWWNDECCRWWLVLCGAGDADYWAGWTAGRQWQHRHALRCSARSDSVPLIDSCRWLTAAVDWQLDDGDCDDNECINQPMIECHDVMQPVATASWPFLYIAAFI